MALSYPLGATVTLAELDDDPHPVLARLREREPVSWVPVLDAWLVTRRDLVLQAMRDPATFTVDDPRFSTARVVGPSMIFFYCWVTSLNQGNDSKFGIG